MAEFSKFSVRHSANLATSAKSTFPTSQSDAPRYQIDDSEHALWDMLPGRLDIVKSVYEISKRTYFRTLGGRVENFGNQVALLETSKQKPETRLEIICNTVCSEIFLTKIDAWADFRKLGPTDTDLSTWLIRPPRRNRPSRPPIRRAEVTY